MLRRCNGADPNLIKYATPEGEPVERRTEGETSKPCDCGKVFDDAYYMTIWPHRAV